MRMICLFVLCVAMMCGVPLTPTDANSDEPPPARVSSQDVELAGVPLWGGEQFRPTTSRTIMRRVQQMTNFSWSPVAPVHNWAGGADGEPFYDFSPDKIYRGIPFTVEVKKGPDPDLKYTYDWPSFHAAISNTPGGSQAYGNSAFGFASIALGLERLYTWQSFLCDAMYKGYGCDWYGAVNDDSIHGLGQTGSVDKVGLQMGDVLLFTEYPNWGRTKIIENRIAGGVKASEQKPEQAASNQTYFWEQLIKFMPARRNNIVDWEYLPRNGWLVGLGFDYSYVSDIAANESGVYIVDSRRLLKYDATGRLLWYRESLGGIPGFFNPISVAVSSSRVYVGDWFSNESSKSQIFVFDNDGGLLYMLSPLTAPRGLGVDGDENLYVMGEDGFGTYVIKFSPAGAYITSWRTDNCSAPTLAVSREGFVYIMDTCTQKIYKWDSNGNLQFSFDVPGNAPCYLTSVAVDSFGYVYAGSWCGITKYDGGGNLISYLQTARQVYALAVDKLGDIYMASWPAFASRISQVPRFIDGPTDLYYTRVPAKPSRIVLNWQTHSWGAESGFTILMKEGVNGDYKVRGSVGPGVTTFTDAPTSGVECFYRVYAYAPNFVSTYSNEVRVETATMKFLSPTQGTIVPSGSVLTIKWETTSSIEKLTYMLDWSFDGGTTWNEVAIYWPEMSFDWQVPAPKANQPNCLIRIKAFDLERGWMVGTAKSPVFTIEVIRVTSPTKGQAVKGGVPFTIQWITNATAREVRMVEIHFLQGAPGGPVTDMAKTAAGDPGAYIWTPGKFTKNITYRIRVVLRDTTMKNIGEDFSPYFKIVP